MEAAGEAWRPGRVLTGPASPRRSVCAPGAMAFSTDRGPPSFFLGVTMIRFSSRHFGFTAATRSNRRPHFAPRLEALEDRTVPTTVMNNLDSGPGSLRAILAAASPGDTIDFAKPVNKITLTSGELAINK